MTSIGSASRVKNDQECLLWQQQLATRIGTHAPHRTVHRSLQTAAYCFSVHSLESRTMALRASLSKVGSLPDQRREKQLQGFWLLFVWLHIILSPIAADACDPRRKILLLVVFAPLKHSLLYPILTILSSFSLLSFRALACAALPNFLNPNY